MRRVRGAPLGRGERGEAAFASGGTAAAPRAGGRVARPGAGLPDGRRRAAEGLRVPGDFGAQRRAAGPPRPACAATVAS